MKSNRNLWPLAIIAAFVIFIAGTLGLVALACSQKTELVSPDYYEQELKFQARLERLRNAARLGPDAGVKYDPTKHLIVISLPSGQVGQLSKGRIQLYRPSAAGLDRQLELKPGPDGVQRLDIAGLRRGVWKLRVLWTAGTEDYLIDQDLLLAPSTL